MSDKSDLENMELFLKKRPFNYISTLARIGNIELVEKFLSEKISFNNKSEEELENNQLYMACFWGDKEAVKSLLKRHANVNSANANTLWTPLHAAIFNEHGPIVMILLEADADPMSLDYKGRTPIDFASASDIIWPHFACRGYTRTPRVNLVDLEVLEHKNVNSVKSSSRYQIGQRQNSFGPPNGDILGD